MTLLSRRMLSIAACFAACHVAAHSSSAVAENESSSSPDSEVPDRKFRGLGDEDSKSSVGCVIGDPFGKSQYKGSFCIRKCHTPE